MSVAFCAGYRYSLGHSRWRRHRPSWQAPTLLSRYRRSRLELVREIACLGRCHGVIAEYRLLDTTRAYGRRKLTECDEYVTFVRRHAEYHRDLFQTGRGRMGGATDR